MSLGSQQINILICLEFVIFEFHIFGHRILFSKETNPDSRFKILLYLCTDLFVSIKEINIPHKWPRPLIPLNNGAGNKLKVEGRLKIKKWHRVKVI